MSTVRMMTAFLVLAMIVSACAHASERATQTAELPDIAPGHRSGVIFVDAMKQAAPWSSNRPLILDRAGNVRFLAPRQVAETVIYRDAAYPGGTYTFLYAGKGRFDFSGTGGRVIERGPGRALLRIVPRRAGIRLRLTATDPADPPHDVRLILPGFAKTYASSPFHPLFVQRLRAFNVLSFKDWMHGDTFVSSAVWPDRPQMTRATQVARAGVAPEYLVGLANATGVDPWFTIPVGATNMYIYQFAALVHRTLDPRLQARFEYGHDVTLPGTPGNAYAAMAGRNLHLVADPAAAARDWYELRSKQMFAIVERAFGADARRARFADGPLAGTPPPQLSRDALERWHAAPVSIAHYMPSPLPALSTAPAPPIPLAAECRSPQCARLPRLDRTSGRISARLSVPRRGRTTTDADESPPDYRI